MRTAIVTGSASGLGRAFARRLARDGWQLALVDIDEPRNRETLAEVEAAGGRGHCESLDVTRPDEWQALRERLQADWPQLDLLVNNAGVVAAGSVGKLELDDWHWLLGVNLRGTVYGCHTMLEWLQANPRGAHILNTASIAGLLAVPALSAYCATKAAVVALSESLYAELVNSRVRVSVVCPGFFASGLLDKGHFAEGSQKDIAHQRTDDSTITADDVAAAAVRAIGTDRLYVVLPAKARWYWRFKRLFPQSFLRHAAKEYDRGKE